jgi:hypothetical protein
VDQLLVFAEGARDLLHTIFGMIGIAVLAFDNPEDALRPHFFEREIVFIRHSRHPTSVCEVSERGKMGILVGNLEGKGGDGIKKEDAEGSQNKIFHKYLMVW